MRSIILVPLVLVLSACSAQETGTPTDQAGSFDAAPDYDPDIIGVPFLVDDHFIPSGCMGDCTVSVTIDGSCPARSSPGAQGECHHFVYTLNTAPGAVGWAGVLWQTVEQNWGSLPGRKIAPGATSLHFYAESASPSVALTILVGALGANDGGKACKNDSGCNSRSCVNDACTQPALDTLNISQGETLGTSWQPITVSFDGRSYGSQVLSGFGWTAVMPPQTSKIEFFVDDIRWE